MPRHQPPRWARLCQCQHLVLPRAALEGDHLDGPVRLPRDAEHLVAPPDIKAEGQRSQTAPSVRHHLRAVDGIIGLSPRGLNETRSTKRNWCLSQVVRCSGPALPAPPYWCPWPLDCTSGTTWSRMTAAQRCNSAAARACDALRDLRNGLSWPLLMADPSAMRRNRSRGSPRPARGSRCGECRYGLSARPVRRSVLPDRQRLRSR
jgi:hypothetical protein